MIALGCSRDSVGSEADVYVFWEAGKADARDREDRPMQVCMGQCFVWVSR